MNLLHELQQTAKKNATSTIQESKEILEQVKENLVSQTNSDLEMLKFFGTSKTILTHEQQITNATRAMTGEYLTENDIYKVCIRYDLKFLNTSHYKNEVPLKALNDLKKFKDSTRYFDSKRLFIIAPKSHFKLTQRPKVDPVLVYKADEGGYNIISTWGNDFSWKRRATVVWRGIGKASSVIIGAASGIDMLCKVGNASKTPMWLFWPEFAFAAVGFAIFCTLWDLPSRYNEPYN